MKLRENQKILYEDGGREKKRYFLSSLFYLSATNAGAPCHCSLSYQLLLTWIDPAFQLLLTAKKGVVW